MRGGSFEPLALKNVTSNELTHVSNRLVLRDEKQIHNDTTQNSRKVSHSLRMEKMRIVSIDPYSFEGKTTQN